MYFIIWKKVKKFLCFEFDSKINYCKCRQHLKESHNKKREKSSKSPTIGNFFYLTTLLLIKLFTGL